MIEKTRCALMGDDSSECIRPSPYDEEGANHRGGKKEDEWKRSYRLRFGCGAGLWALGVSCKYEQSGTDNESDLLGEEKVAFCEFALEQMPRRPPPAGLPWTHGPLRTGFRPALM